MTLQEILKSDLKVAMKSGNAVKRNIIRLVLLEVAAENSRREVKNNLNDEGIQAVIKSMKKNLESIPEDKKDEELRKEIEILGGYLPTLMSEEDIKIKVEEIIAETKASSLKEMGKVMGTFASKYKGKADNKIVMEIIKSRLI